MMSNEYACNVAVRVVLLCALLALTCTLRAEWVAYGPPPDAASRCSAAAESGIGSFPGRAGAPRTPPNRPAILNSCLETRLPASDPIRIRELARSLDFDWRKCFDFVRDNILFEPYFGFLRGAERTLLDREGNDADQSLLLVTLLRECGISATIMYEPYAADGSSGFVVPLSSATNPGEGCSAAAWLGVDETGTGSNIYERVSKKMLAFQRPCWGMWFPDSPRWLVRTDHFWVAADIEGAVVDLDPSFKPCVVRPGRDAAADMGYSRAALLVAAGGTVGTSSAQSLSGAAVDAALDGYAAELESVWTNANTSAADFIGAKTTAPHDADAPTFPGAILSGAPIDFFAQNDDFKNSFRAVATLSIDNGSDSFFLDEVGARTIWMSYESETGGTLRGVCSVDGEVFWDRTGLSAGNDSLGVTVALTNTFTSATYSLSRAAANIYALPVGFGGDARGGMRRWAAERFLEARANWGESDPRAVAAALHFLGVSWQSQTAMSARLANGLADEECREFYSIGVAGQAGAPFVDMKNSWNGHVGGILKFHALTILRSALEHAVLDQLDGPDAPAASTVKLLALANASGEPVYLADANNWISVSSVLSGWPQAQMDSFAARIQSGASILLPQGTAMSVGLWNGRGWMERIESGGTSWVNMMISGGLNGGNCGSSIMAGEGRYSDNARQMTISTSPHGESTAADPVSLPSGALVSSARDLALNAGAPLAWTRRYDSRARHSDGPLGRGWTHGFAARIIETTDPDAVFGGGSTSAAIPSVVAHVVAHDLVVSEADGGLSNGERARRLLLAALVADWWTRRTTGASATVDLGDRALAFHRRADGSYAPPPGVSAELRIVDGELRTGTLAERNGPTYHFDASNRLSRVADISGNETTLFYGPDGLLSRVENGFGASFDVTWSDGRIASVIDSAGRSVSYAYDGAFLTNVTDAAGESWSMEYDPATGALAAMSAPDGGETVRSRYNSLVQVTNQTDASGGVWTFGYAASGGPCPVTADGRAASPLAAAWDEDPLGHRQVQSFDADGRVLSRMSRDGALSSFAYDGHGHLVTNVDALGTIRTAEWDANDNLVRMVEGSGTLVRETSFAYDVSNRLVSVTNALGGVTEFAYDAHGRVTRILFADGTSVEREWTGNGLLSSSSIHNSQFTILNSSYAYTEAGLPASRTTTGQGLPPEGIVESFAWDSAGNLVSFTDGEGRTTSFSYDPCGRLVSRTNALGGVTAYAYSASGFLTNVTDAAGRSIAIRRTPSGKVAAVVFPDGSLSTNIYDAADRLVASTNARGSVVSLSLDAEGRVVSRTTAAGTSGVAYNLLGLPVAATNAAGETASFAYDALSRLASCTNGLGFAWEMERDILGRLVLVRNPLGKASQFGYDAMGRRVSSTRPSGAADRFGHDALGRLVSYTNAAGSVHTLVRDALGRVLSEIDGEGRELYSAAYDKCGNVTNLVRGDGRAASPLAAVSMSYDALNRLVSRTAGDEKEEFSCDATGLLLTASNSVARESFAYDVCGHLAASSTLIGENNYSVSYLRDGGGIATNISYGAGMSVSREYDSDGRLVRVRDWLGHEWTFSHNGEGKPLGGVSPDWRAHSFSYDAAGRLSSWSVAGIAGRSLERDAAGRLMRETVTAGAMPRPAKERRAHNTFDAAGRIVSADVECGAGESVHEVYLHDSCGAVTNVSAAGETVFAASYDAQGRLASLGGPPSSAATFSYDALGNRIHANGSMFIPDHDDPLKRPLLECDDAGVPVRAYIWGAGRLLGWLDFESASSGGPRSGAANGRAASPLAAALTIAHCDDRGNVIALSSADGTILHTAHYGPHGEDWGTSGENPSPFAWLGGFGVMRVATQSQSPNSNPQFSILNSQFSILYLTRHRLYSPSLRRFLSSDPIGLSGGLNLYAYCSGDPLSYVDPLGLSPFDAAVQGFWEGLREGLSTEARIFDYVWNTTWELLAYNPNIHDAGMQQAVNDGILAYVGSPLGRLGAYDQKPLAADVELVSAIWDLGAAATVYRNLGQQETVGQNFSMSPLGQTVYRVWGGESSPWGQSWTPINPNTVENYRSVAGLPNVNSGRFVTEGVLISNEGISVRGAQIIQEGQQGGLTEYLIPNAMEKIRIIRVSGANPEF